MSLPADPVHVHATAVLVGECGVLIEGASGSGKSSLAEALIAEAVARGRFARLIGDDRVGLAAVHGRLLARPHPAIAGLHERRGLGLVREPYEPAGLVRLVVLLAAGVAGQGDRLPDPPPVRTLCGIALPLLRLPAEASPGDNARRVRAALPLLIGPVQSAC